MFARTLRRAYIVHSPRGVSFNLSSDDAVARIRDKYGRRWFGARLDYLGLESPSKEFLPFYLCSGRVHAIYTGDVTYSTTSTGADGKSSTSTRSVRTMPLTLDSVFEENKTQIYAGYKYNIDHVHHALRSDELAYSLRKMHEVDTTGATINLFEQSTNTMHDFVQREVRRQAEVTAISTLRSFHPSADSVSVSFSAFSIHIDEVTPTFVPCYVVKADYDAERYTLYVSGISGQVGGPYLLNSLFLARTTALVTLAAALLFTPNKVAGFIFGSVASVVTYYAAFYFARWYPAMRRNRNRAARERLRVQNVGVDKVGYRPDQNSQRIQQEYTTSSYWDSHAYQQRKRSSSGGDSSSSSSSSGFASDSDSSSRRANVPPGGTRGVSDRLGYYRALELRGDESVNEIRSAYRQIVLKMHPDVGGSDEGMAKVNEAYRVLRDPKRREAYDRS